MWLKILLSVRERGGRGREREVLVLELFAIQNFDFLGVATCIRTSSSNQRFDFVLQALSPLSLELLSMIFGAILGFFCSSLSAVIWVRFLGPNRCYDISEQS